MGNGITASRPLFIKREALCWRHDQKHGSISVGQDIESYLLFGTFWSRERWGRLLSTP